MQWNDNSIVTVESNVSSIEPKEQVVRFSQKEKKTYKHSPAITKRTIQTNNGKG